MSKPEICNGCQTNKYGDCNILPEDIVTTKVIHCCKTLSSAIDGEYIFEDKCKKYHYDLMKINKDEDMIGEEWVSYFCLKYCPFCGIELKKGIKYE